MIYLFWHIWYLNISKKFKKKFTNFVVELNESFPQIVKYKETIKRLRLHYLHAKKGHEIRIRIINDQVLHLHLIWITH